MYNCSNSNKKNPTTKWRIRPHPIAVLQTPDCDAEVAFSLPWTASLGILRGKSWKHGPDRIKQKNTCNFKKIHPIFQVGSCVPIVFQGNTELFFAPSSTAGRFFLPSDVAWLQLGNFPVLAALTKKTINGIKNVFLFNKTCPLWYSITNTTKNTNKLFNCLGIV